MYQQVIQEAIHAGTSIVQGDYRDLNGILFCGKCHTRKEVDILFPNGIIRCPTPCDCALKADQERETQLKEQQRLWRVEELKRSGITDSEYWNWTFKLNDNPQSQASMTCQNYVDNWNQMKEDNIGLLFYGTVGTGKTFLACCVANALLEKGVSVMVTNFPKLITKMQSGYDEDRNELINSLQRYDLLVIDDLGTERTSSFALEQMYNIIDARYRSGKPLFITTNLSPSELKSPSDINHKRIYDRVLEMCCYPIKMAADSKRGMIAKNKRDRASVLLTPFTGE